MRLLHTADWQLGLKLHFVPGDAGARLRAQRFDTVRAVAALAKERAVDAVLVAGDVFEDNGVGPETVQQAREAVAAFSPIPVVLLPGNHDPATPGSAVNRLADLEHVRTALSSEPLELPAGVVHPCPLNRRHSGEDPTRGLAPREAGDDRVRVVVAHGGVLDFGETTETPNRIDLRSLLAKGYDYVALGDYHSPMCLHPRAWYAGTPEATRFEEKDPGHVLIVEVDCGGGEPAVERLDVGRSRWVTETVRFHEDADVERLAAWFDGFPDRSWTLARLRLEGGLSLEGRAALDRLLDEEKGRFCHLRIEADDVVEAPSEADLEALKAEGFLRVAATELLEDPSPEARDAVRLLHRMLTEAAR